MTKPRDNKKSSWTFLGEAILRWGRRHGVSLFLMLVLFIQLMSFTSEGFSPWILLFHKISYQEFGFISRAFLGSTVHCIGLGEASFSTLYTYVFCLSFGGILLASFWLGKIVAHAAKREKTGVLYLATLLGLSPFFLRHLFISGMFGRMDIILVCCFIITCWLITIRKVWATGCVPVVCLIAMLSHHGFYFMFFPAVFLIYLYSTNKRSSLWLLGLFFIFMSLAFLYLQFLGKPVVGMEIFSQRTGVYGIPVLFEYYGTLMDHWKHLEPRLFREFGRLFVNLLILSPIILLIGFLWWKAGLFARNKLNCEQGGRTVKKILCITLGIPILTLPLFLGVDWGRWIASILTSQCAVLLTLASLDDPPVQYAFQELSATIKKRPLCAIMLLIYTIVLPGTRESGISFPRFNEMKELAKIQTITSGEMQRLQQEP